MRAAFVFILLLALKAVARLFYRFDIGWVGDVPEDRWRGHRIAAVLNHTSLYELLWAGAAPASFLWRIARHGVVPIADVTFHRPIVGRLFRLIGQHVVALSRERDHTWGRVLDKVDDPDALVVILPEGRMMRRDGLDKHGKPMTVRGGIAELLEDIEEGRMLVAYSGGLHHVQAPGERLPRLFKTLRIRFESIDIVAYRERLTAKAGERGFRRTVVADMERRRDLYCWPDPSQRPGPRPVVAGDAGAAAATGGDGRSPEVAGAEP